MEKELLFLTVIGKDRKGIVAMISNLLYRNNINIEDINQKVMENYFVMVMLVDTANSVCRIEKLSVELGKIEKKLNLKIQVQHENIFKMMHRI